MPTDTPQSRWKARNLEKVAANNAAWKKRNAEKCAAYAKKHRDLVYACVSIYKVIIGCQDCGEHFIDHPFCLDLDHLPGTEKLFNISDMGTCSWGTVIAEVEKCNVVCSNCHRIRTMARTKE